MGHYAHQPWLKHYDSWVPPHLTYPERPLYEILDTTAADAPGNPATSFLGETLTFGDIKAQSDRLATVLVRRGIERGDRIGIMLPNCPQYMIAAFAILRSGAVIVNISPSYTAREVLAIATDSGLRLLITLDTLAPVVLTVRDQTSLQGIIVTSLAEYATPRAPAPHIEETESLTRLIGSIEGPADVHARFLPDDLAVLQYTGGTTGMPKGAMLTHRNLYANVIQKEASMFQERCGEERFLMVIPYFHIYAFTIGMLMGTRVGALQIMLPVYDVEQVLTAVQACRPTFFPAVPTVFVSLLAHPKALQSGLGAVRHFNTGGAPCPVEVIERWERTFGRRLHQGYGLSETSPATHSTPQRGLRKLASIGVPLSDTAQKIVDLETGAHELPVGAAGELCIAGPQVMQGYWRRPAETAEVLRRDADGCLWLHTGDIARIDEDGYTTIVQRKKDMIIVDGLNVYPSEVEAVLYAHPAVRLAGVIGVPDAYHGEMVMACVVLEESASLTEAALIEHCRKDLAPYKVPHQVEFKAALPLSAAGKILYRVLRDEYAAVRP